MSDRLNAKNEKKNVEIANSVDPDERGKRVEAGSNTARRALPCFSHENRNH